VFDKLSLCRPLAAGNSVSVERCYVTCIIKEPRDSYINTHDTNQHVMFTLIT